MRFRLIRRKDAMQYLENVIVAFALTLLGVRLFLELTGYPQIASGSLHIAHVLWGGVLLFIASLVPLVYRNRPLLILSSILVGAGWGLFIDEVGKFVTADNDYFFRPAAPMIYISFLVLWLVALRVGRQPPQLASDEIYGILDDIEEVIEASVDPRELAAMQERLTRLSTQRRDGVTDELALALLHFLHHEEIKTQEAQPSRVVAWLRRAQRALDRMLLTSPSTSYVFPFLLVLSALGRTLYAVRHVLPLLSPHLAPALHADLDVSPFSSGANLALFVLMNAARLTLAVSLLLSAYWAYRGQDRGWNTARRAFVLAIVVVDLLVFYFTQFSAAVVAVTDVALLGWVNHYRWHRQLGEVQGMGV
jgi:hypothetical protein